MLARYLVLKILRHREDSSLPDVLSIWHISDTWFSPAICLSLVYIKGSSLSILLQPLKSIILGADHLNRLETIEGKCLRDLIRLNSPLVRPNISDKDEWSRNPRTVRKHLHINLYP